LNEIKLSGVLTLNDEPLSFLVHNGEPPSFFLPGSGISSELFLFE